MGSGAFLVAACRYLAHAYEDRSLRTGLADADDLRPADRAGFRRVVAQTLPLRRRQQSHGRAARAVVALAVHARGRSAAHLSRSSPAHRQQPGRACARATSRASRPCAAPFRRSPLPLSRRRPGCLHRLDAAAAPGARRASQTTTSAPFTTRSASSHRSAHGAPLSSWRALATPGARRGSWTERMTPQLWRRARAPRCAESLGAAGPARGPVARQPQASGAARALLSTGSSSSRKSSSTRRCAARNARGSTR